MQMYLLSHVYLYRRLSRSHRILRSPSCLLALSIFYLRLSVSFFALCFFFFFFGGDGPVISICLCYACRCFSFLRSSLKSCYPVSFAYRAFDVWPPHQCRLLLRPRRNGALFSVLSRHSSCHFSAAAASCERKGGGYLAAISGFIFLRYLPGLSRCCRPGVIARRNQGGDLSP